MSHSPQVVSGFEQIVALVESAIDPEVTSVDSEIDGIGLAIVLRPLKSSNSGRHSVRWRVAPGSEVFAFTFDGQLRGLDFDYDEVEAKAWLVDLWVRLSEQYLEGGGSASKRLTWPLRRTVNELTLTRGRDVRVVNDVPNVFRWPPWRWP